MYDSLVHAWFGNQGVTVLWIKLLVHIVSVIDSSVGISQACQKYFISVGEGLLMRQPIELIGNYG